MPSAPPPIADLLARLERAFATLGVRWFLFGAQAAILYGVARLSADVDVTVDLGGRSSAELFGALAEAGFELRGASALSRAGRWPVRCEPARGGTLSISKRKRCRKRARSALDGLLVVDDAADGRALGVEITSPDGVTLDRLNGSRLRLRTHLA